MRILAIDPGNIESAYVLMDGYKPLKFGKVQNAELLQIIREDASWQADAVAIERVASYGMPVGREVFETCEWVGRYSLAADTEGLPVDYVYRADVKLNLCGSSRAKDGNVRKALIDRFAKHDLKNGKGTKGNKDYFYGFRADVWQSYAVGVTWLDARKGMAP